jgi:meiotically up-regulated gene 157 (Mug157) protein
MTTAEGKIWAFEVDGYGNQYFMDDANSPSLLSLPLFGFTTIDDPIYQRTRNLILSKRNPYYFSGTKAKGVGGPHCGLGWFAKKLILLFFFFINKKKKKDMANVIDSSSINI